MMTHLVAQGIPASQVIRDYAGFDTYDSCVRAKIIFGVTRALVVTQEFHLPRAVFLCRQAGIAADGVADPRPGGLRPEFVLREIPGSVKADWDCYLAAGSEIPGTGRGGARGRCRRLSARWGVLGQHRTSCPPTATRRTTHDVPAQ